MTSTGEAITALRLAPAVEKGKPDGNSEADTHRHQAPRFNAHARGALADSECAIIFNK